MEESINEQLYSTDILPSEGVVVITATNRHFSRTFAKMLKNCVDLVELKQMWGLRPMEVSSLVSSVSGMVLIARKFSKSGRPENSDEVSRVNF